jgi:hypothetical protein
MKRNGQARRALLRVEARKAGFKDDEIESILMQPAGERLLRDGISLGEYNDVKALPSNNRRTVPEKEASPSNRRNGVPPQTIGADTEPDTIGERIDGAFEQHCERRTKEVKDFKRHGRKESEFWRDFSPLRECLIDDIEKATSLIVNHIEEMAVEKMPRTPLGRYKTEIIKMLQRAEMRMLAKLVRDGLQEVTTNHSENKREAFSPVQFYAIVDALAETAFENSIDAALLLMTQSIARNAEMRGARIEEIIDLNDECEAALEIYHDDKERPLKKGKEQPKILKPISSLGASVLRHWRDRAETDWLFDTLNPEGMSRGGEAHNKKFAKSLLNAVRRANPNLPPHEQLAFKERTTQDRHKHYDIVTKRGEVLTPYSLRHATSTQMRICNLSDHAKLAGNWKSMRDRDFDERYSRHEAVLMQQPVARSLSQVLDPAYRRKHGIHHALPMPQANGTIIYPQVIDRDSPDDDGGGGSGGDPTPPKPTGKGGGQAKSARHRGDPTPPERGSGGNGRVIGSLNGGVPHPPEGGGKNHSAINWRRGESNPRPEAPADRFLRA